MALVRHKWNTFGRYAFYFNLFYYVAFVAVFTEYMQTSLHPYNRDHLISSSKNANQTFVEWMKKDNSKDQYEEVAKVVLSQYHSPDLSLVIFAITTIFVM